MLGTVQYNCAFVCDRLVMIGSAKALQIWSPTHRHSSFRKRFSSWTWTSWHQQVYG